MTIVSSSTLLLSLVVLALIPGPGILTVVARSTTAGFRHGVSTTVGVVAGDFVFITLALFGLSALSEILGGFFAVVKYVGAVYLVWLGLSTMLCKPNNRTTKTLQPLSLVASFSAGLITTLSNPKAILFYLSIFPALLDLQNISRFDSALIYLIAAIAVGGVMLGYAYLALKASSFYQASRSNSLLRYGPGTMLVSSGIYVAARG
jgi:threonine/homoserine/homoserine lactone efflux protein